MSQYICSFKSYAQYSLINQYYMYKYDLCVYIYIIKQMWSNVYIYIYILCSTTTFGSGCRSLFSERARPEVVLATDQSKKHLPVAIWNCGDGHAIERFGAKERSMFIQYSMFMLVGRKTRPDFYCFFVDATLGCGVGGGGMLTSACTCKPCWCYGVGWGVGGGVGGPNNVYVD